MIMTVGDQIFALNQEVKKLKKRCLQYESALRDIASGKSTPEVVTSGNSTTATGKSVPKSEPATVLVK